MQKGIALILVIFLMVACSLVAMVAFSLVIQGVESGIGSSAGTEAFAIALGGKEWYLAQLANDTDWSDEADQNDIVLGNGTFDITIATASAVEVSFTVTGKRAAYDDREARREVSITAEKIARQLKFAVFWEEDGPNASLDLANNGSGTDIQGDVWFVGSAEIGSNSSVTGGTVFYGEGESITGTGSYTTEDVSAPFPSIPPLDTSYYDNLITDWNARIDDAASNISAGNGNLTLTSDVDWTNQTITQRNINTNGFNITGTNFTVTCRDFSLESGSRILSGASGFTINCNRGFDISGASRIEASNYRINCSRDFTMAGTAQINSGNFVLAVNRDFNTDGTIAITGSGYIVTSVSGEILIHAENSDGGSFAATPSGGGLYFLSGSSLTLGSGQTDTSVVFNPGVFLYARNSAGNNDLVRIQQTTTSVDEAVIIAQRRIVVESGADVSNSILYVDNPGSSNNNYLQITGSGTSVTGAVISCGTHTPSLRLNDAAQVTGIVYQHEGAGTDGSAEIDGNAVITGALLVRQFQGGSLGPATIIYDSAAVQSFLPEGLASGASESIGSWDDH